tara:strand:- start:1021 stop:1788 length:768 start_codon:yes stop_codon:yes gene_type:complete
MAKDPAFLFYPGDWNLGTMHLTILEKGCYLELLVLQFAKGKFTEAQAKHMLNGSFEVAWANIKDKFSTDGKFFWNERLRIEKEKRQKFTESRRINALSPKNIKKDDEHMDKHMHKHMENENININKDESIVLKGGVGENWNTKPNSDFLDLELDKTKGGAVIQLFKFSKNHTLTETELQLLWGIFKAQNFNGEKYYASKNDVYSHFINWSKTQNVTDNGKSNSGSTKRNGSNYKTAGQEAYAERLQQQLIGLTGR